MTPVETTSQSRPPSLMRRLEFKLRRLQNQVAKDVQNPVVLKEMRSAMRGFRLTLMLTIYLMVMGGLIGIVYIVLASSNDVTATSTLSQIIGKAVFGLVVGLEMVMICLLAPALSSGAISAERERQTYDLLRTTLLPARSLVMGKLSSAILFLLVMLVIGFPLQSMAYLFGGVALEEVLISFLLLGICAVFFSVIGIIISSLMKTTLAATVVSYIITIALLFGAPLLLLLVVVLVSDAPGITSNLNQSQEIMLQVIAFTLGYFFVSINPISAAIASEIMLTEQQKLYFTTVDLSYGVKYPVIAPWIIFTLTAIIASLLLIRLAILLLRQAEK